MQVILKLHKNQEQFEASVKGVKTLIQTLPDFWWLNLKYFDGEKTINIQ
jgi:hypothetical protein